MTEYRLWNAEKTQLLPKNAQQEALIKAVHGYFMQAQMLHFLEGDTHLRRQGEKDLEQTLHSVQALFSPVEQEFLYQTLLMLQVANDVLEVEGLGMAEAVATAGQPLVCKAGCTGCCHQMLLCLPNEISLMQAYMQEHPHLAEKFTRTFALWHGQAADLSESYLRWGKAFYGEGKDDKSHCREDYFIPCPLLDEAGLCMVYAVRPYACRSSVAVDIRCAEGEASEGNGQKRQGSHNMLFSLYTGHDAARKALFQAVYGAQRYELAIMPMALHQGLR